MVVQSRSKIGRSCFLCPTRNCRRSQMPHFVGAINACLWRSMAPKDRRCRLVAWYSFHFPRTIALERINTKKRWKQWFWPFDSIFCGACLHSIHNNKSRRWGRTRRKCLPIQRSMYKEVNKGLFTLLELNWMVILHPKGSHQTCDNSRKSFYQFLVDPNIFPRVAIVWF